MPFVKIHVADDVPIEIQADLVRDVRSRLAEVLGLRPEVGHAVVYGAPVHARSTHERRDKRFAFVEILMYPGRSPDLKQTLLQELGKVVGRHLGLSGSDILVVIQEPDRPNWGGGID